jgi:hypothetical protein
MASLFLLSSSCFFFFLGCVVGWLVGCTAYYSLNIFLSVSGTSFPLLSLSLSFLGPLWSGRAGSE